MTNEINVNQDIPNIISGTFTTNTTSANINNPYWRGFVLYLNITQASGTGGLTPNIQLQDPGSGNYDNVVTLGSQKSATGLYSYFVYPATAMISDNGAAVDAIIPRTFRIGIGVGDSSSYTYSVSISMIK